MVSRQVAARLASLRLVAEVGPEALAVWAPWQCSWVAVHITRSHKVE